MAASFHTCFDSKCSAFKITRLIYVHCVSEEQFSVNLKGVECVILHCREMHWSYLESMSERRVSLIPTFVDEKTSEELFAGLRSPVLIRINCSCDITFVNPDDKSQESTGSLIWDFEVLRRNSPAAPVQALAIQEAKAIDVFCHPVELTVAECNCGNFTPNMSCLIPFMAGDKQSESETPDLELQSLNLHDSEENVQAENEEDDPPEENPNADLADALDDENFIVKGSYHEERYQQALLKCDDAKRKRDVVPIRAEFEPDNVQDKNAIKFEVLFDHKWLIIGYCDLKKIPKLRKAMKAKEIHSLSLLYVKREFIPWQGKLSFYACVCIVKKGKWEKDSTNNFYNSDLD